MEASWVCLEPQTKPKDCDYLLCSYIITYAVRSTATPQATKKGKRPSSSCAPNVHICIYVVFSILKTVTRFSVNRHNSMSDRSQNHQEWSSPTPAAAHCCSKSFSLTCSRAFFLPEGAEGMSLCVYQALLHDTLYEHMPQQLQLVLSTN